MVPEEPATTSPDARSLAPASQDRFGRLRQSRSAQFVARAYRVARRTRVRSPILQGLIALVVYLAAWLPTGGYQLTAHPTLLQLDQTSMDPAFYTWTLGWWPHAISQLVNPLHTGLIGVPHGFNLAWVTTIPPLSLLSAALTETAGPTVSFNLLAVVAMPLTAWAAFIFCRRLTRRFWPSLIGGAVFGFSAYEMNHSTAGQLNITFGLIVPLVGYLVLLWRDGAISRRAFVLVVGLAMAVQFYLFLETFADLTAILVMSLIVGYAMAGRDRRRDIARLAALLGIGYALALVLISPYFAFALAHVPPKFVHGNGLDLASLVLPRPHRIFGLRWHWLVRDATDQLPQSMEGYVGVPLFALAVLFTVLNWSSKITRFLMIMLVVIIVAALGPVIYIDGHPHLKLPWGGIWSWPILRAAFPARLINYAFLVLAVMTAIFLAGPAKKKWGLWARWALGLLVVATMVADTPTLDVPLGHSPHLPHEFPAFISSGEYRYHLSPGETVAVVSTIGNAGMEWQADTNFYFRLTGGYINAAITPRTDLPGQIQALASMTRHNARTYVHDFKALVVKGRVGAILVQLDAKPRWAGIFRKIGLRGPVIGGVMIYRTHACRHCHVPTRRRRDSS
jgi:hypothetical protein